MCTINPFCALRPAPDKVAQVATHSVERYSKEQIKQTISANPISFLNVIYAEDNSTQNAKERLYSVKEKLHEFILQKIFIRDEAPCFYIYRQIKKGRHHTGIIGLASVDDYNKGVMKIHEQTLAQREERLKEYLNICEFNAEPVCLTYPHNKGLNEFMQTKTQETPIYDYSINGVSHTVWLVNKPGEIEVVQSLFKNIPAIYIADGHHRAASSARLAEMRRASNTNHTGKESYNFFTAALFADDELTIFSYNRVVHNFNGLSSESFLDKLREKFNVSLIAEKINQPEGKNSILLYMKKNWYNIAISSLKHAPNDPVNNLDVSILSDYILSPLLNIKDLRNDRRISFLPGIKTTEDVEKIVDSGKASAAFCLYPVSFEELINVADSGKEMPPKSTWIEPKLESGLLIYAF